MKHLLFLNVNNNIGTNQFVEIGLVFHVHSSNMERVSCNGLFKENLSVNPIVFVVKQVVSFFFFDLYISKYFQI